MVCPPAEPDPWQRRPRLLDFLLGMGEPLALLLRGPCRRSLSDYGHGQEGGGTDDAELITGLGLGFTVRLCADAVAPATPVSQPRPRMPTTSRSHARRATVSGAP